MSFHVELKDGREVVRAFNLSEDDVRQQLIDPLRAGVPFLFREQEFDPRRSRIVIIEGAHLAPGELGLGLGWTNAVKRGEDVTERFLSATGAAQPPGVTLELSRRLKDRIAGRVAAGPLPLGDSLALTADLLPGHRVSERLAAVELVVWEMLHTGEVSLHPQAGAPALARDQWEELVLDAATWLAPGPEAPVISAIA